MNAAPSQSSPAPAAGNGGGAANDSNHGGGGGGCPPECGNLKKKLDQVYTLILRYQASGNIGHQNMARGMKSAWDDAVLRYNSRCGGGYNKNPFGPHDSHKEPPIDLIHDIYGR
jgi:hypothetical protein